MDEQRIQAYVELIRMLLVCPEFIEPLLAPPGGKEGELLAERVKLVDAGLVAVMEAYVESLRKQGNKQEVDSLLGMVERLKAVLRITEGNLLNPAAGDTAEFLVEILQMIDQTQGNRLQVYAFFSANMRLLDEVLLGILPDMFAMLIQKNNPLTIASVFGDFGNLIQQFPLGNQILNLEMGIVSYEQALKVYNLEVFPEQWAIVQNNLAVTYNNRIRGERAENLERAIASYEQALQIRTLDAFPEQWATTQNNLASAYLYRIRGERAANLERAIVFYEQTLQVYTSDVFPEQWARTQNNLANAYLSRIYGEQAANLERAIASCEQALQIYTSDAFPEEWAKTQNNLANTYVYRICGERAENLERAIACCDKALQVYTCEAFPQDWAMTQNNLANAYSKRIRGERADNLELAIACYEKAMQVYTREAFPDKCRQAARNLGDLYFGDTNWSKAIAAYQVAAAVNEDIYQESISYDGKGDNLKAAANLSRNLAYAYANLDNHQAAVLTLEQSRARGLSETIDRDRANLSHLPTLDQNLHLEYQGITQELRNLEYQQRDRIATIDRNSVLTEAFPKEAKKLREELKKTIAQIRQVPGYEGFLTPTKWEHIQKAVTIDDPLVYLVTTPNGGMALIVTVDTIEVLWLNDLTEKILQEILYGPADEKELSRWSGTYQDFRNDTKANYQTWLNTIESTTRELWDLLMGPIVQQLKILGYDRATLIPTGYLSLLPLHAAWTPDSSKPTGKRYALDDIHFTYTPNAKSLTEARAIGDRPFTNSILAIDNPRQDLPNSQREIDCAIDSFSDRTVLRHDNATIDAVKSGLAKAAIVHFSCHGTANFTEPLNSGLLMSDGLLTLKDLLALNLAQDSGIRLAILSACETGLPGLDNIDEVVSLPIGLLQAGVAGVISSLWSVSDLSTIMLLTRFYDFWRKEGLEPAIALHQAQIWLRDTTNREKLTYFKTNPHQLPPEVSSFLRNAITNINADRTDRTFSHPFHWAAFSYTGI